MHNESLDGMDLLRQHRAATLHIKLSAALPPASVTFSFPCSRRHTISSNHLGNGMRASSKHDKIFPPSVINFALTVEQSVCILCI